MPSNSILPGSECLELVDPLEGLEELLEGLEELADPVQRLLLLAEDAGLLVDELLLGDLARHQLLHEAGLGRSFS